MSGPAATPERAFLDANVLWSAAYRLDARMRAIWSIPGVTLVTSAYPIDEAMRNIEDDAHRGRLIVRLDETAYPLEEGDSMTHPADTNTEIQNASEGWAELLMVVDQTGVGRA